MNIQRSKYDSQQAYATLLHQYHSDEAQILDSEKQINQLQQLILHSPPSPQSQIKQSIKSIINCDPINKGQMITEEQVCTLLEKISESLMKHYEEEEHRQKIQNNLKQEINQLQDKVKLLKREQREGILLEQPENDIDRRIQQIQARIINFQSQLQTKRLSKPREAAKIFEELQEYEKLEQKLKFELNLKVEEENIQKQKLVIQYGKLNKLENGYSEKQTEYLSLLKHYEHIKQRCSLSKKEEINFTRSKTLNYPVTQQITNYRQQNRVLYSDLEKHEERLKEYVESKSDCVTEHVLQEKRQKLQELQASEKELIQEQNSNLRLKRDYYKLKEQVRVLREFNKSEREAKNKKSQKCRSQIEKYKREQNELQQKIERLHQAFKDLNLKSANRKR